MLCAGIDGRDSETPALEKEGSGFFLFPNPAQGEVTLVMPRRIEGGKAALSNGLGQLILENEVPDGQTFSLSTDKIAPGTYHFVLFEDGKPIFTEKLVIIK